jgi:hypothetical protein
VFLLYYIIFFMYQNINLWRLLQCTFSVPSRGIFGIFRGISKLVFTYSTNSRGLLVWEQGCRLAGFILTGYQLPWVKWLRGCTQIKPQPLASKSCQVYFSWSCLHLTLQGQFTETVIVKDMRSSFYERLLQINHLWVSFDLKTFFNRWKMKMSENITKASGVSSRFCLAVSMKRLS